jgi:amino acid transporter
VAAFALSTPFIDCRLALLVGALVGAVTKPTTSTVDLIGGLLIAMWNYMGWDNASTIATEVERPQRTYPRAMLAVVALVSLTYIVPVGAMWMTGLAPSAWETGSWAEIASMVGGPVLRIGLVLGGMISAFGMFNALVMSYSRLPLAMAQDGMLPAGSPKCPQNAGPWVAIIVLAMGCPLPGLGRSGVTTTFLCMGVSVMLEFVALVCLRIREPELPRPTRVRADV